MFVLAVHARRHNGKRSSCRFFSSAKVRSFDILRPNAIGLELDLRFSTLRPIGLSELPRANCCLRAMRSDELARFFSSFGEAAYDLVVMLLAERLRIDDGARLRLRMVIVFGLELKLFDRSDGAVAVVVVVLVAYPFVGRDVSEYSLSAELCLDEMRRGGFGGLADVDVDDDGTNDWVCFGNGANKSMGFDTFVIG